MTEMIDPQMALLFSFFEGVMRKGPGSEASTLKAFSMLEGLPPNPRIVDFGCGAGAASLVLARAMRSNVTAVDIHQPFLNELETIALQEGLMNQITIAQADMADPPFPEGSFDVVWSEGAIYLVGFEQGLKRWRRLLRSGGFIAVTEVTWLCDDPPQKAVDFWNSEYPAMTSVEDNLTKVRSAGFDPIGHFALPSEAGENYYVPLEKHLADFRSEHSESSDAQALVDSTQREVDMWKDFGSNYGYVFYLGRVV
jgi:cyclopropane fatty-acyl-phospholipid synthase-like methyltransferase